MKPLARPPGSGRGGWNTTADGARHRPFSCALQARGLLVSALLLCAPALSQEDRRLANNLPVPIGDPAAVAAGQERFAERCAFCHGGQGRGGKGPCLTCGRFKYGGRASQIYANIAGGVQGTQMGAFESSLSREEILNIIAYLRVQTEERRTAGELEQ